MIRWFFTTLGVVAFVVVVVFYFFPQSDLRQQDWFPGDVMERVDEVVRERKAAESTGVEASPFAAEDSDVSARAVAAQDVNKHPLLSASQEKALEKLGIDPATLPRGISPEQEQCFVNELGQERVDEIKAGDAPSFGDFISASGCVKGVVE